MMCDFYYSPISLRGEGPLPSLLCFKSVSIVDVKKNCMNFYVYIQDYCTTRPTSL